MSYGQNMPWGLQATKTLTSATYSGQSSPYLIASGYANNIFKGDPVIITNAGYIQSLYDWAAAGAGGGGGANAYGTAGTLGVFVGCSFITTTALNPIDPASPGRSYWPANTATLNAVPATAFVIDDPNVIYNIQTNATPGLTQAMMGLNAATAWDATAGVVNGNTNTGTSLVSIDQATRAVTATLNLKLLRVVAISGNFASTVGLPIGYNNAEVIIQNHVFCSRPAAYA